MKLSLKNIGKISQADIEIKGITVIAGENDTGKSTVGKVLFSIFNSCFDIENQILKEKMQNIARPLEDMVRGSRYRSYHVDFDAIAAQLIKDVKKYVNNKETLQNDIIEFLLQEDETVLKKLDKELLESAIDRIYTVITVSQKQILKLIIEKRLRAEFNNQINNIYSENDATIDLYIKEAVTHIEVNNDVVVKANNAFSLNTEAVYIDDPFIIDEFRRGVLYLQSGGGIDHRNHLRNKLFYSEISPSIIDEIILNKKLDLILDKINSVCDGKIIREVSALKYQKMGSDKALNAKSLSTGLKSFAVLKMLLSNGTIEDNGIIILDEPEVHLHPEWQLLFAEIIVLLQKEFNLHILLNTHSPYFLNAVEVYSEKYQISDKCKYYLAENDENMSFLSDVTERPALIYKKLSKPFRDLQTMRYCDD